MRVVSQKSGLQSQQSWPPRVLSRGSCLLTYVMQYLVVVAFLFGVELPKPATFTTQPFHIVPGALIRAGAGRWRFSR